MLGGTCMVCLSACLFKPRAIMGKCKDCGFLGSYSPPGDTPESATQKDRTEAWHDGKRGGCETSRFYCYWDCPEFPRIKTNVKVEILPLIDQEVSCGKWRKWWPGKSPKEHHDMTILEQVRAEQSEFQVREESRRQQWREEDRADGRTTRRISIAALIVSAIVSLAGLAAALLRY